jgi:hypothetical protein
VGWVQRRERLDEVGSVWPVADDVNLEFVDLDVRGPHQSRYHPLPSPPRVKQLARPCRWRRRVLSSNSSGSYTTKSSERTEGGNQKTFNSESRTSTFVDGARQAIE